MKIRKKLAITLVIITVISFAVKSDKVFAINPQRYPRRILPHRIEGYSIKNLEYGPDIAAKYLGKDFSLVIDGVDSKYRLNDIYMVNEKIYVNIEGCSKLFTSIGKDMTLTWNEGRNLVEILKDEKYTGKYLNKVENIESKKAKKLLNSDKVFVKQEGYKKVSICDIENKKYASLDDLVTVLGFEKIENVKEKQIILKVIEEAEKKPVEKFIINDSNREEYRNKLKVKVYFADEYKSIAEDYKKDTSMRRNKELIGNGKVGKELVAVDKNEIIGLLYEVEQIFPLDGLSIYFNPYEQPDYKYYSGYYHEYVDQTNPQKLENKARIDIFTTVRQDVTGTLLHEIGHKLYYDNVYYRELDEVYMNIYPESVNVDLYNMYWDEDISESFAEDVKLYLAERLDLKDGEKTIKKTIYSDKRNEVKLVIEKSINMYFN